MALSIRRSLVVLSVAGVLGGIALVPAPAIAGDKDCPDFSTQRAAQLFFLRHGGPQSDPDRLDADHDGIACEDNPCPCYFKKHLPHRRAAREQAVRSRRSSAGP